MSKGTNDKGTSDIEREFEEELKKEKRPEESLLPEETDFEREYDEEMQGEELPKKKEIDAYAEKFYELSTRKFKTETELDNAVNVILNEIEREYFFRGLLAKTKKGGKLLLKKGVATFKGIPAFQAVNAITQLARGNLKGTLGTLAKTGLRGMQAGTTIPVLKALGFEGGTAGTEQNREAWQNFTNVCKESFDYLARNLHENADDPLEASKIASEAFSAALKKVESELKSASMQRTRKLVVAHAQPSSRKIFSRPITLALGMICIVLAAGLVGAIAYYAPIASNSEAQMAEIQEKDNLISSMNATIASLQSSLNQSSSSVTTMQAQIDALNRQINSLFNYLNLNMSDLLVYNQTLYQDAGANTTIYYNVVQFAGYVTVQVQSSSNTTYVGLAYSSYGVNYDSNMTVGAIGTAVFPVLPSYVAITVGNTDTDNSTVAAIVSATYTY
jgi:polyhydroxyalkanoate synthesis regulator phasin